jgi:hypothetical protein
LGCGWQGDAARALGRKNAARESVSVGGATSALTDGAAATLVSRAATRRRGQPEQRPPAPHRRPLTATASRRRTAAPRPLRLEGNLSWCWQGDVARALGRKNAAGESVSVESTTSALTDGAAVTLVSRAATRRRGQPEQRPPAPHRRPLTATASGRATVAPRPLRLEGRLGCGWQGDVVRALGRKNAARESVSVGGATSALTDGAAATLVSRAATRRRSQPEQRQPAPHRRPSPPRHHGTARSHQDRCGWRGTWVGAGRVTRRGRWDSRTLR